MTLFLMPLTSSPLPEPPSTESQYGHYRLFGPQDWPGREPLGGVITGSCREDGMTLW